MTNREASPWVVLGEILWDSVPRRPEDRLRTRRVEVRHGGGAAANLARSLSRLGVSVALVGAVGADDLGQGLADELSSWGVDTRLLVSIPARTGLTFLDLPTDASDGQSRFLPYRNADAGLEVAHLPIPAIAAAPLFVIDGSAFVREPIRTAARRALAERRPRPFALDLNIRPRLWDDRTLLRSTLEPVLLTAAVVKASEPDLQALGLPHQADGLAELHATRRRASGPEALTIVTRGADGSTAWWGELSHTQPAARARRIVDTSGAGDAFFASMLATLSGADAPDLERLRAAMEFASRMAARVCERLGPTAGLRVLPRSLSLSRPGGSPG